MIDVKPIAFYLPQFYPNAVNDINWGQGFSEWRSVVKAKPLFEGHFQPRLPGALGFYDLRSQEVFEEQADLARAAGVFGFCFYYYRMGNRRLLERPLHAYLEAGRPDFPFMYCWANESWTRAWDGKSDDLLLEQVYDETTKRGLIADLVEATQDSRYIRIKDKPFVLIYQVERIPDRKLWLEELRQEIWSRTGQEVTIGCVFSPGLKLEMLQDVDSVVQFPPHRVPRDGSRKLLDAETIGPFDTSRGDYFEPYDAIIEAALTRVKGFDRMYPGVTPDWDNSPRRSKNAHVVIGSTPAKFESWVRRASDVSREKFQAAKIDAPLLFVNAWNEWAEGAVLEPTELLGSAYLSALTHGISSQAVPKLSTD
ncbi:glycosyltransferase WbsX family protein [Ensifer adhaerens]|uniref:glycosyltransferase WbsX family protein n=1 Tax=Ensifer adhaerens TaxID=106592 RepID=UPI003F82770D